MSIDRKTIPRVILQTPNTRIEAVCNVSEAIEFATAYIHNAKECQELGNMAAGKRARECIHNLRLNAATINKSLIFLDKREV